MFFGAGFSRKLNIAPSPLKKLEMLYNEAKKLSEQLRRSLHVAKKYFILKKQIRKPMRNHETKRKLKFQYIRGDQAYLLFFVENDFKISLDHLKLFYQNLELIVGDDSVIYAHRSDHPYDMREMVKDDGKWKITENGKDLDEFNLNRLHLLCTNYV